MPSKTTLRLIALVALGAAVVVPLAPGVASGDAISDKQAEARQIAVQLEQLQRAQGAYAEQYDLAVQTLGEVQVKVGVARQQVASANQEIASRRRQVLRYAVGSYVRGGDSGALPVLLHSGGSDLGARQGYADLAIGNRQDVINALRAAKDDAEHQTTALTAAESRARAAKQDVEDKRQATEDAISQQRALNDKVQGQLADLVRQEQERRAAEEQRAAEQRAQREAEAARRAPPPPAPTSAADPPTTPAAPKPAAQPTPPSTVRASAPATAPIPTSDPATAPEPTAPPASSAPPPPAPDPPPQPTGDPGSSSVPSSSAGSGDVRSRIVAAAESQVGVPYVYGGEEPGVGFDCSGLMQWAYSQAGVSIPRVATAQLHASRRISLSDLQPGDMVFYNGDDGFMGHVAMYVGNGQIVQALHSGLPVQYASLYFWDAIAGAGRIV